MAKYKAAPGARFNDKTAALYANHIKETFGEAVTPELILDDARDEDSPYHGEFTWDDIKAAHAHRMQEARKLLGSIHVVVKTKKGNVQTRAFVNVAVAVDSDFEGDDPKMQRVYLNINTVKKDADLMSQVIREEIVRLEGVKRRLSAYADLAGISGTISQVIGRLKKKSG
jgi:hypothetical protein